MVTNPLLLLVIAIRLQMLCLMFNDHKSCDVLQLYDHRFCYVAITYRFMITISIGANMNDLQSEFTKSNITTLLHPGLLMIK